MIEWFERLKSARSIPEIEIQVKRLSNVKVKYSCSKKIYEKFTVFVPGTVASPFPT